MGHDRLKSQKIKVGKEQPMIGRRTALGLTLASLVASARAQTEGPYPNRPVRFIVPAAPGGPTDVMARMISPGLAGSYLA